MRFASRCFQPMLTRCVSSISASKVPTNQTLSSIAPNATRVTTLKNGLRVASEDAPGHFVGVGVYVDAGSRYEPAHLRGLSHFTDRMAFKSTSNRSREAITAEIEKLGGNIMCASSRENIMYQANVFRHHIDDVLNLYAETIRHPLLTDGEIEETKAIIEYELETSFAKPEFILPEILHQTAFKDNTLGFPQICQPESVCGVLRPHIEEYRNLFYRPQNLVVAGVGMDHEHLVQLTDKWFGSMADVSSQTVSRPSAEYKGGQRVQKMPDLPFTQMALAFPGVSFDDDDVYAVSTLQVMLGGGDSFSAGGPGKGMYSRLFTNVLNRFHWVETVVASHTCYKDTGLFAIQMAVPPNALSNILDIVGYEIRRVLYKPIDMVELERAKNQLRSSVFMNLESKIVQLEDIGRQVQLNGSRMCPQLISRRIGEVTAEDIKRVTERIVNNKPTMVVLGETEAIPDLKKFQRRFGLGVEKSTSMRRALANPVFSQQ